MHQVMDWHDELHKIVKAIEMDLHALSLQVQASENARKQA
jgi:hypothetical protein